MLLFSSVCPPPPPPHLCVCVCVFFSVFHTQEVNTPELNNDFAAAWSIPRESTDPRGTEAALLTMSEALCVRVCPLDGAGARPTRSANRGRGSHPALTHRPSGHARDAVPLQHAQCPHPGPGHAARSDLPQFHTCLICHSAHTRGKDISLPARLDLPQSHTSLTCQCLHQSYLSQCPHQSYLSQFYTSLTCHSVHSSPTCHSSTPVLHCHSSTPVLHCHSSTPVLLVPVSTPALLVTVSTPALLVTVSTPALLVTVSTPVLLVTVSTPVLPPQTL